MTLGCFFGHILGQPFNPIELLPRALLKRLAAEYAAADQGLSRLEEDLREALLPPYIWLFKRVGQLEGGVKFLVDLRAQLIPMTRQAPDLRADETAALKQGLYSLMS